MSVRIKFPYEPGPDGRLRPYLWLELRGPGGTARVRGLLDSGADISSLPLAYATLLGVSEGDRHRIATRSGVPAYESVPVIRAYLPGEGREIPLHPAFFDSSEEPRWGRDFMAIWSSIAFAESERQFILYAS